MNKTEIKVGQKWKTRAGKVVIVKEYDNKPSYRYPFTVFDGEEDYTVARDGSANTYYTGSSDLAKLVEESANDSQHKGNEMKDDLNEKKYSKQMIEDAHRFLFPGFDDWELTTALVNAMEEQSEQEYEYQEYLRLKEKFKNR